jgi:chemotaxis-related protein WspB
MLVVTFRVGGAAYALRAAAVAAVIPEVELGPLPRAAPFVRGVFAYRGELTPVVDVCQLIAGYRCPARLSSRIALVRVELPQGGVRPLGLLAEHMTEARRLASDLPRSQPMTRLPYLGEVLLEAGAPLQFLEPFAIFDASALTFAEAPPAQRITAGEAHREPTEP